MTLKPNTIAWWDLETTGNQPDSRILEVGIVLTDIRLNIIDKKQILHGGAIIDLRILDVDPFVLKMHSDNGLWAELMDVDVRSAATVDEEIHDWMWKANKGQQHIALAGSGVGHFDRQYIKRDYPRTNKLMTYWPLDVGVVRRFGELAELTENPHEFTELKPHRALDDALLALYEARAWVNHNRELRNLEPWEFSDG